MLSRSVARSHALTGTQCIQARTFFDYIAESKSKGKQAQEKTKESKFSWKFVDDVNKLFLNDELGVAKMREQAGKLEAFVQRESAGKSSIDFDKYRSKIADPTFVDQMEIDFKAKKACLESVNNTAQLKKWKKDSVDEFYNQVRQDGDMLLAEGDLQLPNGFGKFKGIEGVALGEKLDEYVTSFEEDVRLDFEQMDLERNLFTQTSATMKFASLPQLAEYYDDYEAAHMTDQEYSLTPYVGVTFMKSERLRQIRDESERAKWLAEFEQTSRVSGFIPYQQQ